MSFFAVPTELLIAIGHEADVAALHMLTLTCRNFYTVFDPLLWSRLEPGPLASQSKGPQALDILNQAAATNNIQMVKKLLAKYPECIRSQGTTTSFARSMIHAAQTGYRDFLELLLRNGAPATPEYDFLYHGPASECYTPLESAIRNGRVDIVELILNFNPSELDLCHGLMTAGVMENTDTLEMVLDHFPDINELVDGEGIIHHFVSLAHIPVLHKLVTRGANLNLRDASGNTPLHLAVISSMPDILRYLLVQGADCEIQSNDGRTPLMIAIEEASEELVEILLEHGALPVEVTIEPCVAETLEDYPEI